MLKQTTALLTRRVRNKFTAIIVYFLEGRAGDDEVQPLDQTVRNASDSVLPLSVRDRDPCKLNKA